MSNAIYAASTASLTVALASLSGILAKAAQREDAASLPEARLAPDMYPLSWQVQLACLHATNGTAQLRGEQPPAGRPTFAETDLAGLQALIATALETLRAQTPEDFAGAETRQIVMPLMPSTVLDIDGENFLHRWLLPNFYFHLVTAYDILRHKGLEIGKVDFLSHIGAFLKQTA